MQLFGFGTNTDIWTYRLHPWSLVFNTMSIIFPSLLLPDSASCCPTNVGIILPHLSTRVASNFSYLLKLWKVELQMQPKVLECPSPIMSTSFSHCCNSKSNTFSHSSKIVWTAQHCLLHQFVHFSYQSPVVSCGLSGFGLCVVSSGHCGFQHLTKALCGVLSSWTTYSAWQVSCHRLPVASNSPYRLRGLYDFHSIFNNHRCHCRQQQSAVDRDTRGTSTFLPSGKAVGWLCLSSHLYVVTIITN